MFWNRVGNLGLAAQAGLVSAVLVVLWLAIAPIAFQISSGAGLVASAVAAGVCWLGGMLALALAAMFRGPQTAIHAMLLGMLARTMIPLVVGVGLHFAVPALGRSGLVYYLLIFYMATMAVETMLLVAQLRPAGARKS